MVTNNTPCHAAVPDYLGADFREAAPGHRFSLYLQIWDRDWAKVRGVPPRADVALSNEDQRRASALVERQKALVADARIDDPAAVLSIPAMSTAPFTTGLGIEHPLENGFAFLTPYGLPYLPGSSIKGVLRAAARELDIDGAFEDVERSWCSEEIQRLFGTAATGTADSECSLRGALVFHDVYPLMPRTGNLEWDIMNPHQRDYHSDTSGTAPPHDNAPPTPIHFLTVPAGSSFRFLIECDRTLLTDSDLLSVDGDGQPRWQQIVQELLAHAFAWLGFGAKTTVGYGAMARDEATLEAETEERQRQREEQRRQAQLEAMPPAERRVAELLAGRPNPSEPDHRYLLERLEAGEIEADMVQGVAEIALRKLAERRGQVTGPRKKRDRQLQQLANEEARLQKFPGNP